MAQQTLVVVLTITLVLITLMLISVACKCHTLAVVTEEPQTAPGNLGARTRFSRKLRLGLARGVRNNISTDTDTTNTCQAPTSMHIKGTGGGMDVAIDGTQVVVDDEFTTITRAGLANHVYYPLPSNIAYIDVAIKHTYKSEEHGLPHITLPDAKTRPHGALLNITIHEILFMVADNPNPLTETPFSIRAPVTVNEAENTIAYITDNENDRATPDLTSPQIRWHGQKVHVLTVVAPKVYNGAARLLLRSHHLPFPQSGAKYVWTIEHFGYVTAKGLITTARSSTGTVTATLQASSYN